MNYANKADAIHANPSTMLPFTCINEKGLVNVVNELSKSNGAEDRR
jgi:hypothetical protein